MNQKERGEVYQRTDNADDMQIIEADFEIVQERTPESIVAEIKVFEQQVLSGMVEIGRRLIEIKEMVGHGNWYPWIRENLGYTERNVQNFMKIAEKYGDENSPYLMAISKTQKSAHLSISKALALLQVPENIVEEFAENTDIDSMKVKELEDQIKALKAQKKDENELLEKIDTLEKKIGTANPEKDATYQLLQYLQEKQLAAENGELSEEAKAEIADRQEQIDKLKADLEKSKNKEDTLKAEKDKLEAEKQKAIEDAVAKTKEAAAQEAQSAVADTIEHISTERDYALNKIATLEKQITAIDNDGFAERKVKMEFIKSTVDDIVNGLSTMIDKEKATEAKDKLKKFLSYLSETI